MYSITMKSVSVWRKIKRTYRSLSRKQKTLIVTISIILVPIIIVAWHVPTWYKEYIFRTRWTQTQQSLKPLGNNNVVQTITDTCANKRNGSSQLYSVSDISAAINNSQENKIVLIGKDEGSEENYNSNSDPLNSPVVVIDAAGKGITLLCFNFNERLVIKNAGNLEVGFSNFQNISGNALTIASGSGKIHDNIIENSSLSGIFIDAGQWEIFGNTIQKNSSYGIYGGYGSDINIHDNNISENKGYQVRLLKTREIFK